MTAITPPPASSAKRCASVGATEAPVPPTAEPTTATRPRVLSSSWYVPSWFVPAPLDLVSKSFRWNSSDPTAGEPIMPWE